MTACIPNDGRLVETAATHGQVSPEKAHWIDLKDHGAAEIAAVEAQIYATLPNPEEIASIEVSSRLCSIRGAPCF